MLSSMDKIAKIRLSAKILWCLGAYFTFTFFYGSPDLSLQCLVTAVFTLGIQYVFSIVESLPFDGVIPAPWNPEFKQDSRYLWLLIGSLILLATDVLINIGAVHKFLDSIQNSDSGEVLGSVYATDQKDLDSFMKIFGILLSVLVAIGSELLNSLADLMEGKAPKKISQNNRPKIKEHGGKNDLSELESLMGRK